MNKEHSAEKDDETMKKLDDVIQKKKEEIASFQRLLQSIEKPILSETDQLSANNEKDNNSKSSE